MKLSAEERKAVVDYRTEKARRTLLETEALISLCQWNTMANRLYYCVYYAVSALLIHNGFTAHTHSGVRNLFALHFVKTGKISKELFDFYSQLFDYRLKGDYDDFFDLDEKKISPLIQPTKEFITTIEKLILGS
jgi:uncharacterized protein (UPF0332 family)